ncbi:pectin lyase F protein [Rutstroemia sp. NJR-2017a WRK4]|nr:pectin lyase F protein [Rutstroemia sp. NJR-2017a WRK4]
MHSFLFWAAAALLPLVQGAGVTGSATGSAYGVTGGGDATPVTPTTTDELLTYLTDSTPRVILITKEFDFTGSMGTATETGCIPSSNTCGSAGQNAINAANNWCGDSPSVQVTYDKAGITGISVASNKSIVGVGSNAVIKGRGLRLQGVSNVIIQNVHLTDLNPQYIWGGDLITLVGTDMIWIDHCKFSLTGRQMIVTGYEAAGRVTISNNEFDGATSWSASCNGHHYWTMLFLGAEDYITLVNNYIHTVSGRAPKVGGSGSIFMHAVNNYFYDVAGHDFDVAKGGNVLIEGNYFDNVTYPITSQTASDGGYLFNMASGSASTCSSAMGQTCQANTLIDSGAFADYKSTSLLATIAKKEADSPIVPMAAADVPKYVLANAGVGKLSASGSTSASSKASSVVASKTSSVASSSVAPSSVASSSVASSKVSSKTAAKVASTTVLSSSSVSKTASPTTLQTVSKVASSTTSAAPLTTGPAEVTGDDSEDDTCDAE